MSNFVIHAFFWRAIPEAAEKTATLVLRYGRLAYQVVDQLLFSE